MPEKPLSVTLRINCGSRTTSCRPTVWPTEVEASITVIVMTVALKHTRVTGGVVVVTVT